MSRSKDDRSPSRRSRGSADSFDEEETVLHVANLTRNVTQAHLEEIFGHFGELAKVDLAVDPSVKLSKGWAHVEFKKRRDAEDALIHMDGGQVDGNELRVNFILVGRKGDRDGSKRRERSRTASRSPSPRAARRREDDYSDDRRGGQRGGSRRPDEYDRRGYGVDGRGRRETSSRRERDYARGPSPSRRSFSPRRDDYRDRRDSRRGGYDEYPARK